VGVTTGTYYVRVLGDILSSGQNYSFVATVSSSNTRTFEIESNNTQAQANTITSGKVVQGQTSSSSDDDWYTFAVGSPGTFTADISTLSSSSSGTTRSGIELVNSTGTVIARSAYSITGSPGSIETGVTAGTYYLHVPSDLFYPHSYQFTAVFPAASSGGSTATTTSTMIVPVLFSNSTGPHSYLRVTNPNSTAGTVSVTIRDELGTVLGNWRQQIPANASPQFDVAVIEAAAGIAPPTRTGAFARYEVAADFDGLVQQVLWNPNGSSLTSMSVCDQPASLSKGIVGNVHTSNLPSYPSQIVITSSSQSTTAAAVEVRDSTTGILIGTWTSPSISPNGSVSVPESTIETALNFKPTSVQSHITLKLPTTFTGAIAHYVNNVGAGVVTDMTSRCVITKTTLP
jgi:hypothetical protein